MLYPRTTILKGKEVLVSDDSMVGFKEHMTQEHRILFFNGYIGARCVTCGAGENDSRHLLMALDTLSHDPIKLVITSPGGDLDTTFLFYDTMKSLKSPVITIGEYCASGAAILLAAGSKRYLRPHAKVMLHLPAGQMGGDSKDWDIQHKQMESYRDKVVDILVECGAKKSREEILSDIDRDYWLDSPEAIAYGLADEILTPGVWEDWIKDV